jgi:ketosteroid isomerase-like protein
MLLPACAPQTEEQAKPEPQVDVNADKEAITKVGDQLIAALESNNVDGIMACLTDDHVTMAPDVPVLDDLDALGNWHKDRVESFAVDIELTSEELEVIGDWAFQRWSISQKLTPKAGGDPVQTQNKGIWTFKRQADGQWKLACAVWNSDGPPPAEPTT